MKKQKNLLQSLIPSTSQNELYQNIVKNQRLDLLNSCHYSTWNLKQEMSRRIKNQRQKGTTQSRCRTQISEIQIRPKSFISNKKFKGDKHKYNWIIKQHIIFDQNIKKPSTASQISASPNSIQMASAGLIGNERVGSPGLMSYGTIRSCGSPGIKKTESREKVNNISDQIKESKMPEPHSPRSPGFIYNGKIKLRVQLKNKTQTQEEPSEQQKSIPKAGITQEDRQKLAKFCTETIVMPDNQSSTVYHQLDKTIRISNIQYQYITTKFPLNTALKSLFLDEALKQSKQKLNIYHVENEELEKYYDDKMTLEQLQAKEKTYQKHEQLVREEYRRKCYFEYENMKQLKLYINKNQNRIIEVENNNKEDEIVQNEEKKSPQEKKNHYRKIMAMVKQYLLKLSDLKLTIKEVIIYQYIL